MEERGGTRRVASGGGGWRSCFQSRSVAVRLPSNQHAHTRNAHTVQSFMNASARANKSHATVFSHDVDPRRQKMQHPHHTACKCSGELWSASGGSWIGHLLPGVALAIWGLHWLVSTAHSAAAAARIATRRSRNKNHPCTSTTAAHHSVAFLPAGSFLAQHLEPVLKIVLPAVAIALEFGLSGTRRLRCPAGSAKPGELDPEHLNSWSHASNYLPLMLSGLVDLVHACWVQLPRGMPHLFLSAAFANSAFLMLAHGKAQPLDALVHRLLGCCMAAVAATVMLQGATVAASQRGGGQWHSALGAAKSVALIMQGCWFLAITHIMFSADAMWAARFPEDMTRTMFVPVLFAWVFLGVMALLLAVHLATHFLLTRRGQDTATTCKWSYCKLGHAQRELGKGTAARAADASGCDKSSSSPGNTSTELAELV